MVKKKKRKEQTKKIDKIKFQVERAVRAVKLISKSLALNKIKQIGLASPSRG